MGNESTKLDKGKLNTFKTTYGVTEEQLNAIKATVKKHAKGGKLSRDDFTKIMQANGTTMTPEIINRLFDSFDTDNSGQMEIDEYLALMGVSFGGTPEQKLKASFSLFDKNGDGSLTKDEVLSMLHLISISALKAQASSNAPADKKPSDITLDEETKKKLAEFVDQVFEKVDKDKSESIDMEEFQKGFSEHPETMAFFKQF